MNQTFHRPDFALLFFFARDDLRLRSFEHVLPRAIEIVPVETERRRNFIHVHALRTQRERN